MRDIPTKKFSRLKITVPIFQAAETVDIMDEMRTVYNAFLPLFPYCYAYWKRYSDLERKKENWQRSLAILHR